MSDCGPYIKIEQKKVRTGWADRLCVSDDDDDEDGKKKEEYHDEDEDIDWALMRQKGIAAATVEEVIERMKRIIDDLHLVEEYNEFTHGRVLFEGLSIECDDERATVDSLLFFERLG